MGNDKRFFFSLAFVENKIIKPDKMNTAKQRQYNMANSGSLYFRSTVVIPGGICTTDKQCVNKGE